MTFSGYNVEQRSKEVKALKTVLAYSLIGSMTIHVGVLVSGIGNFLARVPQDQEEPIEIAIVDPITTEVEKPPEETPEVKKPEPLPINRSEPRQSIASSEIAIAPKIQSTTITPIRSQSPVVQKPVEKTVTTQKPQPTIQPQQTQTTKPVNTQPQQTQTTEPVNTQPQQTQTTKPVNTQPQVITSNSNSSTASTIVNQPQATGENSDRLRQLLGGIRSSRATQGNSTGVESNQSGGTTSTSTPVGSSTGGNTNTGTVNSPVATAPTPPKIRTEPSNSNRSLNGRAACRECNARYPEAARKRGIEGRVEVAVDTDANGNVTNVRVARSSGNRELDEETLRQARNWKLKPAEGGRQGVAIATEFALQGSRRYRQIQEQKKRREAEARNRQTATNTDAPEGTRRRRRLITTTDANIPAQTSSETRVRRRRESTPQTQTTRQPSTNTNTTSSVTRTSTTRETLRRIRRERTTDNSAQQTSQNTNRRRRRENGTSASQSKLRATLRNLRQPTQSQSPTPPVNTAPATQE